MDLRQDTTLGDGDTAEQLVEFLVVSDGELQVSGDDSGLLVVSGGVTGQFEDFSRQVFEDGWRERSDDVDRGKRGCLPAR